MATTKQCCCCGLRVSLMGSAHLWKFAKATGHIVANWGIDEPAIPTGQTLTTWAVGVDTVNGQCWDINTVDSSYDPRRGSRLNDPGTRFSLLSELTDDFDGDAAPHDDFWYVDMQTSGSRVCPTCVATASYAWAWCRLAPAVNLPLDSSGFVLSAWAADGTLQGTLQPVWEHRYYDYVTAMDWVTDTNTMLGGAMVLNGDSPMVIPQAPSFSWPHPSTNANQLGPSTVSSTPDQPDVPRIYTYEANHPTKADKFPNTGPYRVGCWATQDEAGFVACDTTPFAEYGATADAEHEDWEVQYPSDDVNLWPRVEWANAWYYLDSSGAVVKTWDTGNDHPVGDGFTNNADYGEIVLDNAAVYSARANAANGNIILKVDNTTRNILKSADGSRQNITLAGTPLAECIWDQYYYAGTTFVKAYSLADGTLQWTCNLTNWATWGSQTVLMIADANYVYITTVKSLTSPSRRSRGVVAIKADDGTIAWERRKIPAGGGFGIADAWEPYSLTLAENHLYLGTELTELPIDRL